MIKNELPIAVSDAVALIPAGEQIHTFQRSVAWSGCDVDRSAVVAAIETGGATLSPEAAVFDHYLLVVMNGKRTFVETDPDALRRFCATLQ